MSLRGAPSQDECVHGHFPWNVFQGSRREKRQKQGHNLLHVGGGRWTFKGQAFCGETSEALVVHTSCVVASPAQSLPSAVTGEQGSRRTVRLDLYLFPVMGFILSACSPDQHFQCDWYSVLRHTPMHYFPMVPVPIGIPDFIHLSHSCFRNGHAPPKVILRTVFWKRGGSEVFLGDILYRVHTGTLRILLSWWNRSVCVPVGVPGTVLKGEYELSCKLRLLWLALVWSGQWKLMAQWESYADPPDVCQGKLQITSPFPFHCTRSFLFCLFWILKGY